VLKGGDPWDRAFALFLRPHPAARHLVSFCVPSAGNLPIFLKNAYARGLVWRGEGGGEGNTGAAGID